MIISMTSIILRRELCFSPWYLYQFMQRQSTKIHVKETIPKLNDNSSAQCVISEEDTMRWFAHYEDVKIGKP